MSTMDWRMSPEMFSIDLNAIRDDNLALAVVGLERPQRVPGEGEEVVVVDEDGASYRAVVEAILPDNRLYLRIAWATKLRGFNLRRGSW